MSRYALLVVLALSCLLGTGCRNGCRPAATPWFAGQSRIAPPPTYSLNIPSRGGASAPYYTPGNVAPIDATAATGPSTWQVPAPATVAQNPAPTSVLTNPVLPTTNNQLIVNASDYQITGTQTPQDPTRLPVTDATSVRAPSTNYNTATSRTMAQTYAAQTSPYSPYASGLQRVVGDTTIVPTAAPSRVAGIPVAYGDYPNSGATQTGWRTPERTTERFE